MVLGTRNVDRTDGGGTDTGDTSYIGSGVFTRLLRIFSRRVSEPPRVCKPRIWRGDDEDVNLGFPDGTDFYEMISELLATIQTCCQQAKVTDATGFCFGLLDPISNIIVNTVIDNALVETEEDDDQPTSLWHGRQTDDQIDDRDMNQRSLHGLVAFLAGLFPHLSDTQALWYLHKAKADPLLAARIIIKHRRMDHSFRFGSDATAAAIETALHCAAAAADHPNPKRFLTGWRILSPSLKKLAVAAHRPNPKRFLTGWRILSPSLNKLAAVLSLLAPDMTSNLFAFIPIMELLLEEQPHAPVFDLSGSWDLASSRLVTLKPDLGGVVYPGRTTMRRMLLTTIHGYYLQALARLPRDLLCSQHLLYSMMHYGHCFGPLDPVSNIIFNTIWYNSACPLPSSIQNPNMDMVSTTAMLRIAVRSFYGLVSFMCTRYDALTVDRAMHDLLEAGADLRIADPNFHGNHAAARCIPSATVQDAYAAAAAAACHPQRQAHIVLLRQSSLISRMGSIYLKDCGPLSRDVVDHLFSTARHLSSSHFQGLLLPLQETPRVLDRLTYNRVNQHRISFWNQHARVVRMVKSALDMYNSQPGVPKYELHVICSVNEYVHGPEYITGNYRKYHHSHINFLATCKESQSAGALPVLFFAQWSNDGTKEECFCCPVGVPPLNSEQVRCLYCEYEGSRIVHPANESFHGRDIEFEKMLCGRLYSGNYSNNCIIEHSCSLTFWVNGLADDSIYSVDLIDDDDKEDGVQPVDFQRLIRLT